MTIEYKFLIFDANAGAQLGREEARPRDEALDNYVRLVVNNFFAALDEGIPLLGIPVLDPMVIGNLTIPTLP